MDSIPFHPVSEIFPLMEGETFRQFSEDIKANGLREEIWMHDGKIIDGRNRYRACIASNCTPRFRNWDRQGDLVKFVVSLNLHRRHMNESQRAMVGAKIANLHLGDNQHKKEGVPDGTPSIALSEAASMMNVGRSSVARAKEVHDVGVPELVSAVEKGEISVAAAFDFVEASPEVQRKAVSEGTEAVMSEVKKIRSKKTSPAKDKKPRCADSEPSPANDSIIKVNIDTTAAASAAAELCNALDTDFLEELVTELSGIISRKRAAQARGLGPARRE